MVELKWKELLYDIEQQTYRITETRRAGADAEMRDLSEIDKSDSLVDIAWRLVEEGTSKLRVLLSDRLEVAKDNGAPTDELDRETVSWRYQFKEDGVAVDEHTLAMLMHRFVVGYAVAGWTKQFLPEEVGATAQAVADMEKELKNAAFSMDVPVKKRRPKYMDVEEVSVSWEPVEEGE